MKGKIALVTGADGGLGTFVTQALLDAGATVVGLSQKIQQSDFNSPNFTALPADISTASWSEVCRWTAWYPASAVWTFSPTPWVGSRAASPSPQPTMPRSSACSM